LLPANGSIHFPFSEGVKTALLTILVYLIALPFNCAAGKRWRVKWWF
jgi:hypothetical protein